MFHNPSTRLLSCLSSPWLPLSWIIPMNAVAFWAVFGSVVPLPHQAAIYLICMVLLNLPHGAVENWLNLVARSKRTIIKYVIAFGVLIAAFLLLYKFAPIYAVGLAILVAVLKNAGGDRAVMASVTGADHLSAGWQRVLAYGVRGSLVMVVPALVHPAVFQSFTGMMVALDDPAALPRLTASYDVVRDVLKVLFPLAVGFHVVVCCRGISRGSRSALIDLAEVALLISFFVVLPTLVAVGLYFPFWYSARQLARAEVQAANVDAVQVSRWTLIGLVGLVVVTAGLGIVYTEALTGAALDKDRLYTGVAAWTMFISTVALPHVVIGGFADTRGLWRSVIPRN